MEERGLGDFLVTIEAGVAELTLDREGANTIDRTTASELAAFIDQAPHSGVRAMLITGAGRHFCVGAAMDAEAGRMADSPIEYRLTYAPFAQLFEAMWETETPIVTAVNGSVAGVGWMLALLGDIVVADSSARWTHLFARGAMVPHAGDPFFLSRVIPYRRLTEIALLSEPIDSETLERWNVISRSVAAPDLMSTARDIAARVAAGPTRTLGLGKQLYRRAMDSSLSQSAADERACVALNFTTDDRNEGLTSLLEHRSPKFVGR